MPANWRLVRTTFWDDNYISELGALEKYLFLYFLTNNHTHISGVYQVPKKYILLDTCVDWDEILRITSKFERDGKMIYRDGWVVFKKWIKHQQNSPKIKTAIVNDLKRGVPEWVFDFIEIPDGYPIAYQPKSQTKSQTKQEETSEDVCPVEPDIPADPPKVVKGERLDITEMIVFFKDELDLTDFSEDSRSQRARGMNLVNLKTDLGEDEFARRWKILKNNGQKRAQMNSLGYIYAEMKAQPDKAKEKAKKEAKKVDAEQQEKKLAEETKKARVLEERMLDEYFESLDEDEKQKMRDEAVSILAGNGKTRESEEEKGRGSQYDLLLRGTTLAIIRRHHAANIKMPQQANRSG